MTECPRCYGSPAIVMCALCLSVGQVSHALAAKYRASKNQSVDAAISMRESDRAMMLIRDRTTVLSEDEICLVLHIVLSDGRSMIINADKRTGSASCVTSETGKPLNYKEI